MSEHMIQDSFVLDNANEETNKEKSKHYTRDHKANDYLVDMHDAMTIIASIVGRTTCEKSFYHSAQENSKRLIAEGKSPCMIVVKHVTFYSRQFVEDWAKAYNYNVTKKDAVKRTATEDSVADIRNQIIELNAKLDRLISAK